MYARNSEKLRSLQLRSFYFCSQAVAARAATIRQVIRVHRTREETIMVVEMAAGAAVLLRHLNFSM